MSDEDLKAELERLRIEAAPLPFASRPVIGGGTHQRVVVSVECFIERVRRKMRGST
jgi:hypothetical protein